MLTISPRILFRRGDLRILGPLGCFDIGDNVRLEDENYVVTSIDHDGAGIARPAGPLIRQTKELMEQGIEKPDAWAQTLATYENVRTSYALDYATPRAQAGMLAQQARNREAFRS